MTTETMLTDAKIYKIATEFEFECDHGIETNPVPNTVEFARAIEQAVLQSPEIQAMRKDADRYRHLRDQGELEPHDIFNAWWLSENGYPQTLDAAIDIAMEEQS